MIMNLRENDNEPTAEVVISITAENRLKEI